MKLTQTLFSIKISLFSVHFKLTSIKSNFSWNIGLPKTFIVTWRETIAFKFNLSFKLGVIYKDYKPLSNRFLSNNFALNNCDFHIWDDNLKWNSVRWWNKVNICFFFCRIITTGRVVFTNLSVAVKMTKWHMSKSCQNDIWQRDVV